MKVVCIVVLLLWGFVSADEPNNATNKTPISLEEVLQKAKVNYPLYKNTKLLDEALQFSLSRLNFNYIPHIKLNGKVSYQSDVTTLPFTSDMLNTMMPGANINYKPLTRDQYQFTIEISQPVFDSGNVMAQKAITKAQYNSSKASIENNLYQVQQSVMNVYFSLLLLDEYIAQSQIHLKELEKNLKYIQNLYNNGVAYIDDVNKIQIEILDTKRNTQNLITQKEIAMHTLSQFSNLDMREYALIVPDFDACMQYLQLIKNQLGTDNTINALFDNRPELTYYSLKAQEAEVQKKLELSKSLPYLDLFFQGGYGNPGLNILKSGFQPYYIAGVRLSWDFSNLYSKHQQNEVIKLQKLQITSQKEEFLLNAKINLTTDIHTAYDTLHQLGEYEKSIQLQEQIVQNAESKLLNGTLSVNDLITDVNKLNLIKVQRNYEKIEFLNQIYNIKQILNLWNLNDIH